MRTYLQLALLAFAFVCSLSTGPAQAQRVFVSATGSDSNPCTFSSPCRSFQHAHDVTSANGEIDVLDPAGYGSLTITKAISIQGHGFSGISVANGATGIIINAPATDKINLNGLLIDGSGVGLRGITYSTGKSLTIENCVVRNLTLGLFTNPSGSVVQSFTVSNSYFTDNSSGGILIETFSSGTVTGAIDKTILSGGTNGLNVNGDNGTGAITVSVTDSVVSDNSDGIFISSLAGKSAVNVSLMHSTAVGNFVGVFAEGTNATLWLSQSTLTGNAGSAFRNDQGGVIMSYGDNYISAANGSNIGSLTTANRL